LLLKISLGVLCAFNLLNTFAHS